MKSVETTQISHEQSAYTDGYVAGQFVGRYAGILIKNIDLIIAIGFIWMLIFVYKEAILLKKEQELTI